MDCRILRQVTLKADGHLACDDSVGYKIDLGHVSLEPGWRLLNILDGPIYSHIRESFAAGKVPWVGTCEKCDLFSDAARPVDTLNNRISLLVEPTLECSLSCACCARKDVISKGRNTSSLDAEILRRLIDSCNRDSISINEVHYQGQGEPLKHVNFRMLFDVVKAGTPAANQIVTTTGNIDFCTTIGDACLDRLIVSCDGPRQEVYQKYRKGGNFGTVIRFMQDAKKHGNSNLFLEWKYIVFEYGDSEQDILLAQEIADKIGVDSLLFIITNSKWHSKRYTVQNIPEFPIRSAVARVSPSAAMNVTVCECICFTPEKRQKVGFGFIDFCVITAGKMLNVEGWALENNGRYADHVELIIDGVKISEAKASHRRIDVIATHPTVEGANCGFIFRIPVEPSALPSSVVVNIVAPTGHTILGGITNWSINKSGIKRRSDFPTLDFDLGPRSIQRNGIKPIFKWPF